MFRGARIAAERRETRQSSARDVSVGAVRRSFVLPSLLVLAPVALAVPTHAFAQAASGDAGTAAPASGTAPAATGTAPAPESHPESSNNLREAQAHVARALDHFREHQYT